MLVTVPGREAVRAFVEDRTLEEVVHVEKAGTELVGPARYDIWDVLSTDGRWWVITNPLRLYSQTDFKRSVALHFHVGFMLRISYRPGADTLSIESDPGRVLPDSWRLWEQALEAYDSCEEAENFQAVGGKLRECMVCLMSETATASELAPAPDGAYQAADVGIWAGRLATVAAGGPAPHLRSYLTRLSVVIWEYINWLTNAETATRLDAELGVKEVYHFLGVFGGGVPEMG
jgi:hypothetical protein